MKCEAGTHKYGYRHDYRMIQTTNEHENNLNQIFLDVVALLNNFIKSVLAKYGKKGQ
jgi:hypothetical protein